MHKTAITILGLLSEKPMHGYEIKQIVKHRWMDIWARISVPTLYNTINRLKEQGYISEHRKEKIGKSPERSVYELTENGRKHVKELVELSLFSHDKTGSTFWLAVAFINHADTEIARKALSERLAKIKSMHEELSIQKETYVSRSESIPLNWQVLVLSGIDHMEMEIKHIQMLYKNLETITHC